MDYIVLIGSIVFGLGMLIGALNTKYRWSFWKYPYVSRSKKVALLSWILVIIGLIIVVLRAYSQGYIG